MFKSMNIPRKLGLSFLTICASAAIMMIVFYANVSMIRSSTDKNNLSQQIYAKALALETALLRQNSQFRGYLVTSDATYLKSYYEARDDYDKTSTELEALLTDPAKQKLVEESRTETIAWRRDWGDKMIGWVKAGRRDEAVEAVRAAGKAVLISKPVLPLRDVRDAETQAIDENSARQESAIRTAMITLLIGGIALIGIATGLAGLLSRMIAKPIARLTATMAQLAAGKNDVAVPDVDRADELGDMARAVLVFRDAAVAKLASDQDLQTAIGGIGETLNRLSKADLTVRLNGLPSRFEGLSRDFNDALDKLSGAMRTVRNSVDAIKGSSGGIQQAATDLSHRSEQQAANLRESAQAMGEITQMVREGAALATNANNEMSDARGEAEQGGTVVRDAIQAMNGIDQATREISEIINVIDGIAFQTNLLALNAGVEAARAGDAGKGFAVVASEVRALAQRAADAARDVKKRVNAASDHVKSGVQLVDETGHALTRIIERVASVSGVIGSIAASSENQSSRLGQVNTAINEMDAVTQQDAAMVEETTAASQMLAQEADELAGAFAIFTVDAQDGRPAMRAVSRPAPARQQPRAIPRTSGNLALKEDDWSEF